MVLLVNNMQVVLFLANHDDIDRILILKQTGFSLFTSTQPTRVNKKAFSELNGISVKS